MIAGKFPHTRAQLSAIARQFKPDDTEAEPDDYNRVPQSFLNQIVSLLVDEQEDELKVILKSTFTMDDDSVRLAFLAIYNLCLIDTHRSNNTSWT